MTRVAIIGGGPGGLMTAYLLEQKYGDSCQATLFEASGRTGGKIVTAQFDAAPVIYEAGAAEFYNYAKVGPDPLLELIEKLGLKTTPMSSQTVVLDGKILRNKSDIRRLCGRATLEAIEEFRERCVEAMPKGEWYEGSPHFDNTHPWASRSCEDVLDDVTNAVARRYLKAAVHSDLATEPHLTNGLNGLKNFLMDVPGYLQIYSVEGGNQRVTDLLRQQLSISQVELNSTVTHVEKNRDESYRVSFKRKGQRTTEHEDFDAVFVALPHNSLGSVEWRGETLRKAMDGFIAYYDRPGHYVRVTVLFGKPFWREQIRDSWFMLDAFGGCCVYDESARHDAGQYGVLSWLIAGTDALSLSNFDDQTIEGLVLDSLPDGLRDAAIALSMEARVHRWMASINGQPGGIPVRDTRSAHLPEPAGHPALFTVGDYVFDSTINGVLDSADFATDFFQSWRLTRDLLASAASRPSGLDKSYFDRYHHNMSYEDSYDWYFDAKYVRDFIRIVWKARPPYRLLDAGSANGLTLKDFADYGIKAWGVENNKYIHRRTKAKWRKRNLLGDIRKLPFPDGNFDFVYETCLAHLEPDQLGPAIREIHRVCRRGVIFGSLTSDMNPELFRGRDLLMGIKALMPLWEWGELFTANGFAIAATDETTLDKLWRGEEKYNEGDDPWYPDRESLRYCFYTRLPVWPARRKKV